MTKNYHPILVRNVFFFRFEFGAGKVVTGVICQKMTFVIWTTAVICPKMTVVLWTTAVICRKWQRPSVRETHLVTFFSVTLESGEKL